MLLEFKRPFCTEKGKFSSGLTCQATFSEKLKLFLQIFCEMENCICFRKRNWCAIGYCTPTVQELLISRLVFGVMFGRSWRI